MIVIIILCVALTTSLAEMKILSLVLCQYKMFPRRDGSQLSDKEKGALAALTHQGLSIRQIAGAISCSPSTVVFWQRRLVDTEDVKRKSNPGSGRTPVTTVRQDGQLLEMARAQPINTIAAIIGKYTRKLFFYYKQISLGLEINGQ